MEWRTDAFFSIGKTHMVCQDYARSGTTRAGHPYAIVCDGCSSSPDTDLGSRFLAMSFASYVEHLCDGGFFDGFQMDIVIHARIISMIS